MPYSDFPANIISKNHRLQFFILIASLLITYSCVSVKKTEKNNISINFDQKREIRVRLYESNSFQIDFDDIYLLDDSGNKIISSKDSFVKFVSSRDEVKCEVNNKSFFSKEFSILPKDGKNISFNDISYKGYFKVVKNNSQLLLVNYVDIEDYVKGVMLKEMPLGKGIENYEALKAFSILSRTYVMKRKLESNQQFDAYPDTRDQVYGGMNSENEVTNKLVDLTKGQILYYDNTIATVFYHSTCGGYTENVENVFNSKPLPYLVSKQDNHPPNCEISPRFFWEESFNEKLILKRLFESKLISDKNSQLKEIKVISRFNSGRVNELKISLLENKKLKEISLFSNNIRFVLKNSNGSILPSTNFVIKIEKNKVIFKGKGFGHGVGMCQWGSIFLSRKGLNFNEIISFYFPKTEIKKIYD